MGHLVAGGDAAKLPRDSVVDEHRSSVLRVEAVKLGVVVVERDPWPTKESKPQGSGDGAL